MKGPLEGLTVIDLTRVLAGPYCTMTLSDLGARVIKIEPPGAGDDSRHFGPFLKGKSAYFMSLNRGKESLALNLKDQGDLEVLHELLATADILAENYRPGTMEKLGLGYESLREKYPRLIYAAASGFGHTGPYSKRPAYDMVVQAMGGIMSLTGHPGGPPTRVGTSVGDITAGLFMTIGVNAALFHRERTGQGMKIDISMMDCQVAILENAIARYFATGEVPGPLGARHPSITPFAAFACRDGHIVIAAGNDALFAKMGQAIGRTDLPTNPLFLTNDLRTKHQAALKDEIEDALRREDCGVWLARLEEAGVPAGPINNVKQVLEDPHIAARGMVVSVDDAEVGKLHMAGNPIKMSLFADKPTRGPVPSLDGDRERIMADLQKRKTR
jgi:CoA:oxalate CoA-transferase